MRSGSSNPRTRRPALLRLLGATAATILCVGLLPSPGRAASPPDEPPPSSPGRSSGSPGGTAETPENYDARDDGAARPELAARRAGLAARAPAGVRALRGSLGRQGIVEIDPLTATPRRVARLDGYLTGPSRRPAREIALNYVRGHLTAFNLTAEEVAALELRRQYVDVAGTRHLSFVQRVGGVPVFGNGLKAHVAADGRLIQVDGSPLRALPATTGAGASLTAERARERALADAHGEPPADSTGAASQPGGATPTEPDGPVSSQRGGAGRVGGGAGGGGDDAGRAEPGTAGTRAGRAEPGNAGTRADRAEPGAAGTPAHQAEPGNAGTRADRAEPGSAGRVVKRETGPERQTTFAGGDRANLVIFQTLDGPRLAWQTITLADGNLHVVDATTGRILFRLSLVAHDSGLVWENYPGASRGGQQRRHDLTGPGWLPAGSPRLAGNVAHVYTDLDDDDVAEPSEEVTPGARRRFHYPYADFTATVGEPCSAGYRCSWDPAVPGSWEANRRQNATQLFYFLGTFHDHLLARPIGFTRAAGNFEAVDGDAVQGQALDGAAITDGLPDAYHVDNANMTTPPDGMPPRMQMYLFGGPGNGKYIAGNSGDTADIVYHEYTHGLSARLVVDAAGVAALGNLQAGAMGEGWSDWYALDYLVASGLEADTPAAGEVRMGKSLRAGGTIRTSPVDCPVGTTEPACTGGGYTYGDYGRVGAGPQTHADGEIWAQTLWDLRAALGSKLTRSLVTRAMELSPANPSYLDMRNSILQADLVAHRGRARATIWKVFAARGMGWFAGSLDGDDTSPVEDFSLPPVGDAARASLTGRVVDGDTGAPVAGALVGFGGHASGFAGDYAATTAADGTYTISGMLPGTYPKMFARAPGYDVVVRTLSLAPGDAKTQDWSVRRDWVSTSGGGQVVAADASAASEYGCDPPALFDQSQGTGWTAAASYDEAGVMEPRSVTVRLPRAVDITELRINPSATCAHSASSGTSRYRVETSPDGVTWVEANAGDFGLAHRKLMNKVPLAAGTGAGVRFIRYTMLSTQVEDMAARCPGTYSGCYYVDSVELAVYGLPSTTPR